MSGIPELLLAGVLSISPELALENTNIAGYDRAHLSTDYNRIRAELSLSHEQYSNLAATLIVDNETSYTTSPNELDNELSLYRAYGQYQGERHFWSIGKQRIPLGVGRIWNPIDVFNPVDVQAVETDERSGTDAIRYEYALSELSNLDLTIADGKAAIRLKGYLEYADIGLIVLQDNGNDQNWSWGPIPHWILSAGNWKDVCLELTLNCVAKADDCITRRQERSLPSLSSGQNMVLLILLPCLVSIAFLIKI